MKKAFGQTVRDLKRGVNKKVLKESGIKQKVLDATSNESWGPHGSLLAEIAHASRNYHEYQLTMGVLWKRLTDTGKNWRHVYKALIVLEYLVGHGSERAIDEIKERTYQISILADFQYVDSSGKDQGSNVRKKSQSLVALVNDKERISEIREKASANRDKYRNEGRYGDKDDGRSSYGGEREYCYKDDDKNSRDGDRYSRDSDSNMDDEQRGRRKSVDNNENGSRGRSSDRERSFEDDGHSSSRDSGARADDYSRAAPPSYEEAVNESQSPVYSERDGGETPQVIASEDVDPLSAESINVDNQNTSFVNETPPQKVKAFDEFDPRGSFPVGVSAPVHSPQTVVSTASPTSNNAEMDLLGSLSDVFSPNSMAIVTSDSTNVETNIQTNTGPPSSFSTSQSSTQPFDDPFGDSPFKAITSADTYPSEHQSFGDSFQPTPPTSNPENDHNIRCGEAYYAVSNPELNIQNMQAFTDSSTFPQEEFDTSHSEIDILAGILPPSGPPDSQSPQPNSAMSTLQFPPNGNMYESFHSQAESTNPNMSGHTPFGQASKQYNMPGQSHFGQTSQQHNMPRQTTFDQASEPHNMAGQTPFGQTSEQYNMSGQTSFGQASQQHNMLGQTPFGQTTQQHNMSRQISFGQASQQHNMSGHTPFGQASQQENISGQILSGQVSQQHNMSRQNSFDQTSQQHNMLHTPFVHASQQHNMSQIPFGHASQQYNMSSPSQNSSGDVQFKNEGFMQQPQQRTHGLSSHPTNESSLNQPDSATSSGSQTPHFTTPNGHFDGGKPITQQAHGLSQQVHGIPSHTPQRAQSEPVGAYEYNNNGDVQFNNGGFTQQPIQYTSGLSSHSRSETFPNQPGFATSSDSQTPHSTTPNALGGQSEGGNYVAQQAHGASQQVYGVPSHSPHRTKSGPVTSHNNNNNVTGDMFAQTGVGSLGTSASQPSLTPLTGAIEIVSQTQTQKKFEPKSTIWADTLSRGLVNFNISGPKTNPLADIGVDFAAINRKEKRLEKSTAAQQQQVTSTINMGKAMGSGTGLGRAGASAMRPPPNSMVGSSMPMPMGMNVGGYGGMNQNHPMGMNQNNSMGMGMNMNQNHMMGMGMGMNMNQNQHPMGMSMNINQNQHSMGMGDMNMGGYGQGYSMQPQQGMLMASGPQPGMNNTYNPMMGQGGYNPQQQQPYGRGYQ